MDQRRDKEPSRGDGSDVKNVGLAELFTAFLGLGASGFGGVLPFARRMLVDRRQWMTPAEFTEVLGLSQLLPGPNVAIITIYVGAHFAGWRGAAVSLFALLLVPLIIVLCLGALYDRYGDLPVVADAFRGIASAAAGLIVALAAKIAWPVLRSPRAIGIAAMMLVAIVVIKVPLVWALAMLAPVSIAWTWWDRG